MPLVSFTPGDKNRVRVLDHAQGGMAGFLWLISGVGRKMSIALLLWMFPPLSYAGADCVHLAKVSSSVDIQKKVKQGAIPYPDINSKQVAEVFLKAVDRGELLIFKKPITRSMLKPERVIYSYSMERHLPTVSVYSALTVDLPFPDMPDVLVEGVNGTLDWKGHITESSIHCK